MTEEIPVPVDTLYALAAESGFPVQGVAFAARASGLYRSVDGGATWQYALESLNLTEAVGISSVVFSPDFGQDETIFAGAPGGILRSQDAGSSWQIAGLGTPPPFVSALAVSPNYLVDGTLWAATMEDGVFCSTTRGDRWALWNFGLLDMNVYALAVSPQYSEDETLLVGTETGIFRSTNGGRAWREVNFPMELAPVLAVAFSPGYANDSTIYAGTEEHGLYRSTDRGKTWQRLAGDTIQQVNAVYTGADGALLVLSGDSLTASFDGGFQWEVVFEPDSTEQGITAVALPRGWYRGAPVLAGFSDGSIKLLE